MLSFARQGQPLLDTVRRVNLDFTCSASSHMCLVMPLAVETPNSKFMETNECIFPDLFGCKELVAAESILRKGSLLVKCQCGTLEEPQKKNHGRLEPHRNSNEKCDKIVSQLIITSISLL